MTELLKKLMFTSGVSGREHSIREVIKNEITPYADEISVDPVGNLIARKKGNGKKIMFAAHMDEIGYFVTFIDDKPEINLTLNLSEDEDALLLTWEDATDEDVYGYEVTWNKSTPINRSAAMEANSMMVAPGTKGCFVSNLTNGTEYTFTVKSVDTSGNKSEGVSKTIIPSIIEKSPLAITLTANTSSKTRQDVVISVKATTVPCTHCSPTRYALPVHTSGSSAPRTSRASVRALPSPS